MFPVKIDSTSMTNQCYLPGLKKKVYLDNSCNPDSLKIVE